MARGVYDFLVDRNPIALLYILQCFMGNSIKYHRQDPDYNHVYVTCRAYEQQIIVI